MFKSRQQRITERILEIRKTQEQRKPKKAAVRKAKKKSKVETAAQNKTALMLEILNNKKLKAGVRLEKVFKMLNGK